MVGSIRGKFLSLGNFHDCPDAGSTPDQCVNSSIKYTVDGAECSGFRGYIARRVVNIVLKYALTRNADIMKPNKADTFIEPELNA